MGGPTVPSTTTQINKVELPPWVDAASQENFQYAKDITSKPLQQYTGQTVADLSPITTGAYNQFQVDTGGSKDWTAASGVMSGLAGSSTPTVSAGQLKDVDLSAYINPYIDNVEKTALGALDKSRTQALMANADKAKAAGAFGGSRSAIVDAVTNSESADAAGRLSAQLRSDAFDKAAANATADINRKYSADTANQGAELSNRGIQSNAASALATIGDSEEKQRLSNLAAGLQMGMQDQSVNQQKLDAELAKFTEARDYDLNNLNTRLSALGMSPYGKTETQQKTTGGGGGADYSMMGLGILSLLPALIGLSDESSKTDVEKVGKDPATGIDLYAYRYKGDPKSYPKVVGPMAQDIEKKDPSRVVKLGGKKGKRVVIGMGRPMESFGGSDG